jgi:hypothetical protein
VTGCGGNWGAVVDVGPAPCLPVVELALLDGGVTWPAGTGVTATLITRPRKERAPVGCVPPTTIGAGRVAVGAGTVVELP